MGFNVLRVSRAPKALNYNYCLFQFHAYNPLIWRLWKTLSPIVPASLRQRPFNIYIGEMFLVAQKAK